jgi:hypothetical protein
MSDNRNLGKDLLILIIALMVLLVILAMVSNVFGSLLTAVITVITGIFVYVGGQFIDKFYIQPLQRQRECIEEIAYSIVYYADLWANPGHDNPDKRKEASEKLRGLASKLAATSSSIRLLYPNFIGHEIGISYDNIKIAKNSLIGISNSLYASDPEDSSRKLDRNHENVLKLEKSLDINTNLGIDRDGS